MRTKVQTSAAPRRTPLVVAAGAVVVALTAIGTLALFQGSPAHRSASARTSQLGEVTGIAYPCVGITTLASYEASPVHVVLRRGPEVVAAETVTGHHHFALAAPPGRYLLTSDQYQRPTHIPVVVRSLGTAHADLSVSCK